MMGLSASVDVANNTSVIIPWNTVRYSSGATITYDSTLNRFNIPLTGLWVITWSL